MQMGVAFNRPDWRRMLSEISSHEVAEWMAYLDLNPFGEYRDDYRAALIAWTIAQAHSTKPLKMSDFMPVFWDRMKPDEPLTLKQKKRKAREEREIKAKWAQMQAQVGKKGGKRSTHD